MIETEFTQPLFKFLETKYFNSFMNGDIHLSNVLVFRKESNSEDLIDDLREGECTFHPSILGFNTHVVDRSKRNDVFIFCATKSILSDSLRWAIKSNRLSCCLIVSPQKIFEEINKLEDLNWIGRGDCQYIGRDMTYFSPVVVDEELEKNCLFIKPHKYKDQLEHRVCWDGMSKSGIDGKTIGTNKPSLLIRVDLIIPEALKCELKVGFGKISFIEIKVYFFGTDKFAHASLDFALDLFTPIVFRDSDGIENIGFRNPTNTLCNAYINGGGIAKFGTMTDPKIGMLVLCCEVKRVSKIEYYIR